MPPSCPAAARMGLLLPTIPVQTQQDSFPTAALNTESRDLPEAGAWLALLPSTPFPNGFKFGNSWLAIFGPRVSNTKLPGMKELEFQTSQHYQNQTGIQLEQKV